MEGSAGTESRCELKRTEGREGLEPGHVRRRSGLEGVNSRVRAWSPMALAWDMRKEMGSA